MIKINWRKFFRNHIIFGFYILRGFNFDNEEMKSVIKWNWNPEANTPEPAFSHKKFAAIRCWRWNDFEA